LTLETGSPDALCPALPAAREAVERRLGTLVVESGAGWSARYTIAHAPEGTQTDFVRLELFAPNGTLQLSRDLPLEAGACSTVAEAIALVLDRYFRKLPLGHSAEGTAPAVSPADSATQLPPAATSSPPLSATPLSTQERLQEPAGGTRGSDRLEPFWSVGALFGASTSAGLAVGLQGLRESWPHLYTSAELSLAWNSSSEQLSDGSELKAHAFSGAVAVGWGRRWGALCGYVGPALRVSLERGSARGLAQNLERDRARSAAGLLAGLVTGLGGHWSLSATTALDAALGGGQFVIDRQEVLRPPFLEGRLALGVGYGSAP
jgi:hypothetical protein